MKIAFISQYFFPEQFSNNAIVRDMVRRGHEVEVVCGVPNYPAGTFFEGYSNRARRSEVWEGAQVRRVWTVARGQRKISLLLNYLTFPVTASWALLRRLTARPDVALVSMPSPLLQALAGIVLKKLRGVPLVYWVQDLWPESAIFTLRLTSPFIVRPLTWLCGWIYRQADIVLVQSAAFPKRVEGFGVDPDRIHVFPNTAPDTYRPLERAETPALPVDLPPGAFRLMFAGNIGESQGFDTLIDAAVRLRGQQDLHWLIVGSGRDQARAEARIRAEGLDGVFHFLGRHPEEQMPAFFAQADALLVSLKDTDIFRLTVPYKVQCYMACGRPLVASLSGEGARVIADAGAGRVAPAGDADALAQAISEMIALPEPKREAMGQAGRAYFEAHYAQGLIYDRLEGWLEEAARKNPAYTA